MGDIQPIRWPGKRSSKPAPGGVAVSAHTRSGMTKTDTNTRQPPETPAEAVTWAQATAAWAQELRAAGSSPGTIDVRLTHLRRLARICPTPFVVGRPALIAFMAARHWSPEYRRSIRSSIRGFYGWAHSEGMIPATEANPYAENPAAKLPKVRVPIAEPRPAPDDAIRIALAKADERQTFMLLLGAVAGERRAEIASVHTRDLDGNDLRIHGKGGRQRVVPLTPALARRIRQQPDGWLFPNGAGGHLTSAHIGVLLRRILPKGVTPHMLRHAAATALADEGLSILELRKFLGHASAVTTQRYVFIRDQRLRAAAETAAARFIA